MPVLAAAVVVPDQAHVAAVEVGDDLAGDPVVAAPPSAAYRLRKFVVRRKKTVAAVALGLAGGMTVKLLAATPVFADPLDARI